MKAILLVFLMLAASIAAHQSAPSPGWQHLEEVVLPPGQEYELQEGEQFEGPEITITAGPEGLVRNTNENKLEIKDGKIINTTYARSAWIDPHMKIQKVRKVIHTPVIIDSVYEVVKAFGDDYGAPLSDLEFELFNAIAITDGNHFHMNYAVRQVKRKHLAPTLRKMLKIFSVPLSEDDIAAWIYEIDRNCTEKYKIFPLDTAQTEVHRKNKWLIRTEVLMATCGQPSNAGFQLFAWAAYKDGAYKPGQYSAENSETVDGLVTRWLYANMRAMVDCERDDSGEVCRNEETSTLSEFSLTGTSIKHVHTEDTWQEHAQRGGGFSGWRSPEEPKNPNPAMSDKIIWNRNNISKEAHERSQAKP